MKSLSFLVFFCIQNQLFPRKINQNSSDRVYLALSKEPRSSEQELLHTLVPILCRQEPIHQKHSMNILIQDGYHTPHIKSILASERAFVSDFQVDYHLSPDLTLNQMKPGDCLALLPIAQAGTTQTLTPNLPKANWYKRVAKVASCIGFVFNVIDLVDHRQWFNWMKTYASGYGCFSDIQDFLQSIYETFERNPLLKDLMESLNWAKKSALNFLSNGTQPPDLLFPLSEENRPLYQALYPSCVGVKQTQRCHIALALVQKTTVQIFNSPKKPFQKDSSRPSAYLWQVGGFRTNPHMKRFVKDVKEELDQLNQKFTSENPIAPPTTLSHEKCRQFILNPYFISEHQLDAVLKNQEKEIKERVGVFFAPSFQKKEPNLLIPTKKSDHPLIYRRHLTVKLNLPSQDQPYLWHLMSSTQTISAQNQNKKKVEWHPEDFFWIPDYLVQALPFECAVEE